MYVCIAVIHTQFSKQIKGLANVYIVSKDQATRLCTHAQPNICPIIEEMTCTDNQHKSEGHLDLNITHLATLHFAIYSFLSYYSLYFVRVEEGIATCFKFPPFSEIFLQVITFVSLKCILQPYSQLQSQMVHAFISSRIHKD